MADELRPIQGYEGLYAVTRDGRVWSEPKTTGRKHRGRWLAAGADGEGYPAVALCKAGTQRSRRVHTLVAEAWLPNPDGLPFVNHLNGIKTDNRDTNLAWCTAAQNNQHAYDTGLNAISARQIANASRMGKRSRSLTFEQAQEVRRRVASGERQTDVARRLGVRLVTVNAIVHGKTYPNP